MKKIGLIGVALALILCTGCFASPDEESSAATPATTAATATTTVATTTTTRAPGGISEYPCTAYATDSLNVRRTPNTDYDAIGGLHEGEQVTVIGREGDFYKINFKWDEGTTAYVSAQYISINRVTTIGSTPTVANPTVATTTAAAAE